MRQSLGLVLKNGLKYFKTPLVEGQYAVIPPKKVPEHIIKPNYVDNPNPIFGIYEGKIFTHNNTSISSKSL